MEVLSMGLPCEGAADCALREFSPFWGPPSHDKKTVEECNDDGGLVRKKDAFREQWHIWGRNFNPMNVFAYAQKLPTTHSGTSHLLDTNPYFIYYFLF